MNFTEKFKKFFLKISKFLPWFSLVWGIISGTLVSRDYSHSSRVLTFFVGFLFLFVGIYFFSIWQDRIFLKQKKCGRLTSIVLEKAKFIEWLAHASLQMMVQYLLMFSLTFLFFSKAWFMLLVTVLVLITTLWDPWWEKLSKLEIYQCCLRVIATIIAFSFIISVFFSSLLPWFQIITAVFAILVAMPWKFLLFGNYLRAGVANILLSFFPAFLALICLVCIGLSCQIFPIISIWIKNGELGFNVDGREVVTPIGEMLKRGELYLRLKDGDKICCKTPVVAPKNVRAKVIHKWFVNNVQVDEISLGEILGLDDKSAFRTFSCKKNIILAEVGQEISCQVFLGENVRIGTLSAEITN